MNLSLALAFERSWNRTVRMLFRPFDLGKWCSIGFAAFLSEGLAKSWGGGTSYKSGGHGGVSPDVSAALHRIADFLSHPVWGTLIILLLSFLCVLALVVLWLNCRGRFVFLDNVVHERAAIAEPWRRYRAQGNSLFLFTLVSLVVCGAVLLFITLPVLPAILDAAANGRWKALAMIAIGGWIIALIPVATLIACFFLFLYQFVVPLMFRHQIGVRAAWGRFLGLLGQHPLHFLGFVLGYLLLSVLFAGTVVAVGLATCCIGFMIMGLPYIGSVVLLPVEVLFRGLGPEVLSQFGPDYFQFGPPSSTSAPA